MDNKTKLLFVTTLALFLTAGVLGGIILERKVLSPKAIQQQPADLRDISQGSAAPAPQAGMPGPPPGPRGGPQEGPQGGPQQASPNDSINRFAEIMTRELSLDSAQQAEIREMLSAHKDKFESTRKDIKKKLDALDLTLSKKILEILTDEQKQKFQNKFAEWPKPVPPPGAHQGPPPEAFAACRGKQQGQDCSFTDVNGAHNGKCGTGAKNEFVCMPGH